MIQGTSDVFSRVQGRRRQRNMATETRHAEKRITGIILLASTEMSKAKPKSIKILYDSVIIKHANVKNP